MKITNLTSQASKGLSIIGSTIIHPITALNKLGSKIYKIFEFIKDYFSYFEKNRLSTKFKVSPRLPNDETKKPLVTETTEEETTPTELDKNPKSSRTDKMLDDVTSVLLKLHGIPE